MKPPPDPHYRHRFPAEIISYAVWLYHVFSLSLRDVELLLAERGVVVSYETVRRWCKKFGASFAERLRRHRPRPGDKWHLDEALHPDRGRAAIPLARGRSEWCCARHPGSGSARWQRREALLQAASEGFAIRPTGDRDRQAEELWCRSGQLLPGVKHRQSRIRVQSGRKLASADATTRAADATVQIVRTSAGLSLRSFVDLRSLASTSIALRLPHMASWGGVCCAWLMEGGMQSPPRCLRRLRALIRAVVRALVVHGLS